MIIKMRNRRTGLSLWHHPFSCPNRFSLKSYELVSQKANTQPTHIKNSHNLKATTLSCKIIPKVVATMPRRNGLQSRKKEGAKELKIEAVVLLGLLL